jgi:hypothetical protein
MAGTDREVYVTARILGPGNVPIRELLENDYRSAFGPEEIANLAAAFDAALSKLGGPHDNDSGKVDHRACEEW